MESRLNERAGEVASDYRARVGQTKRTRRPNQHPLKPYVSASPERIYAAGQVRSPTKGEPGVWSVVRTMRPVHSAGSTTLDSCGPQTRACAPRGTSNSYRMPCLAQPTELTNFRVITLPGRRAIKGKRWCAYQQLISSSSSTVPMR